MGTVDIVPPVSAGADAHRFAVAITGADFFGDYLCLGYLVTPVPAELLGGTGLREGGHAGIAVDSTRSTCQDCTSAYRISRTGAEVLGALKFGPAAWPDAGCIAVLFAPFAHTPALHAHLCEVRLDVGRDGIRTTSVRAA